MTANTNIKIICENDGSSLFVSMGTTLQQVSEILALKNDNPFLACYVNNELKELSYLIYGPVSLRFIDITHFEGMRVYQRTLFFIMNKAVYDLYPDNKLRIKHSVARGFYAEIEGVDNISDEEVAKIKERMQILIDQNVPIVREKMTQPEAEEVYAKLHMEDKIALMHTRPHLYVTVYSLANLAGFFYGSLCISTKFIHLFDLRKYFKGIYIAVPQRTAPTELEPMISQDKMFDIFNEYADWVNVIGVSNIGAVNGRVLEGRGGELIKIAEALHEKKLAHIGDVIHESRLRDGVRIVLISGPSSSGKTTFAKRLGIQLQILGLEPVLVSLDDYFVDRDKTPRDHKGDYDYETIDAIDLELFNNHLNELLEGKEVAVPRYDFITGKRTYEGDPLKLDERSVLVIEGIHALNPKLTAHIEAKYKFRVYISALTSISLDNLNRIATTDNRLIRRIVRDARTRGASASDTLARWGSVRRGEEKWIFPYQEEADIMFNSSLFYEISVLKELVKPLLYEVPDTIPEYGEARRLLRFLDSFTPLDGSEIPPTSILREFIGGSSFTY